MSLYRRIILLAAAVAAVSALLVGVYGALYLRGMILEERTGRALAEARLLAEVLADPVYTGDLRRIREVVGGVGDGDLLGIEVADAEGRIIFRTGDPGVFLEGERIGGLPPTGSVRIEHAGRVLSLVVPIEVPGAPPLGYLRLAEDMSVFKAYILRATVRFAGAGVLLALLAGLVGGMVARRVVRPIEALARGVRRLGQGEAASLPTERKDEIGALARAFSEVFARTRYLQAAIEQAPTPVILTDRDRKIFYVNPAFSELSGYAPKEALGKTPEFFRAYGEGREVYRAMNESLKRGEVWRGVIENRGKGGRHYVTLTTVAPVRQGNEVTHYVAVDVDITRQRQQEAELREAQAFLEELVASAPVVMFRREGKGCEARVTFVSPNLPQLLGYPVEAWVGQTWGELSAELVHPEDRSRVKARVDAEAGEAQATIEYRLKDAEGRWRWVRVSTRRLAEGVVVGFLLDLTREREARQALEAALAQSRTFGLYVAKDGSTFETFGPLEAVTGYHEAELGRSPGRFLKGVIEYVHPEDREALMHDADRVTSGEAEEVETLYRFRHPKKGWRWHRAVARGRGEAVSVFIQDVTELIEERAKAEAEKRANAEKTLFLSRMSHELRTPLNAVLGFAQLLEMDELTPTQREEVGHIRKAGRHLLALINEVLDVARVDAGRVALSLEPVLAEDVVREVLDLSGPIAAQAGVRLSPPSGEGLSRYAYADRQRLVQVLLNLVTNAIRYNRSGGAVWVRVHVGEETLRFEVEDTGIGIPEAMRDRVFEPFDRLGRERGGGEGTGLGLSIAKRFVELMGGEIGFESREGVGTTFHFVLPQAPSPREEPGERAEDDPEGGHELTLLYIEDNPANLRLIESLCARIGAARIIAALQGGLGLRLAREHRPDVIILDMELPDMSGEAVLARLKGDLKTRDIPVIVLSASASPNRIDRVLSAGAYAYLTKPLEVKRFLELLSELGRGR